MTQLLKLCFITGPLFRIRGGFVIVERIPRDSEGNIMINLDKFDDIVVHGNFLREGKVFPGKWK